MKKLPLALLTLAFVCIPFTASAHQPRVVTGNTVTVVDPEVSKAYYGKLIGEPAVYTIVSDKPFLLYVNLLVPDIEGQKKDISAVITKDGTAVPIAVLDGTHFTWEKFHEPFGNDTYFKGPEYKARVEAGTYVIRITSGNNDSKYSLALGEAEVFDYKETVNSLTLIPLLKRDFFNESPATFLLSPFGSGLVIVMFVLAFAFGFAYRFVLRKLAQTGTRKGKVNIGRSDRLLRVAIGLGLLIFAITTTWSPVLLFFSGFCFFEAIFSWCGFFAAIGRSTCPVE